MSIGAATVGLAIRASRAAIDAIVAAGVAGAGWGGLTACRYCKVADGAACASAALNVHKARTGVGDAGAPATIASVGRAACA
jgi:hypothetical protein